MSDDLSDAFARIRVEYGRDGLEPADLPVDPLDGIREWIAHASASGIAEPNIVHLATVDPDGRPSARALLVKDVDTGVVFFTNYDSRKGRALAEEPRAGGSILWQPLHRQIRVEGLVERVSTAESDAYFMARPEAARRSAEASPQSRVIPNREWLEQRADDATGDERPASWGGYRLIPDVVEFWQGRQGRLHDRVLFRKEGDGWVTERLAP